MGVCKSMCLGMCFLFIGAAVGCSPTKAPGPSAAGSSVKPFAQSIRKAQGAGAYHRHQAVSADFHVNFGKKIHLAGTMTIMTDQPKVRMMLEDGSVIVYNRGKAWVRSDHKMPRARFDELTWPWFMELPFEVGGPGMHVKALGPTPYRGGEKRPAAKMTFSSGVGDSPDDWYLLFKDPATNRLTAAAYIVTYGKTRAEAEKHPHAIEYGGFQTIDGVTFATRWGFAPYDMTKGIGGKSLGEGRLSNIHFVKAKPDMFQRPKNSEAAKKP